MLLWISLQHWIKNCIWTAAAAAKQQQSSSEAWLHKLAPLTNRPIDTPQINTCHFSKSPCTVIQIIWCGQNTSSQVRKSPNKMARDQFAEPEISRRTLRPLSVFWVWMTACYDHGRLSMSPSFDGRIVGFDARSHIDRKLEDPRDESESSHARPVWVWYDR